MTISEKNIIKEFDLKDNTFNLKSQTTGKYSVHDSYRDNLKNEFLTKINAPEDVKNALKDIYYATEKGLVISYKDFNGKIATIRRELLSKSYPGKDIKDLPNDERLKIEMTSAKQVLKDLSINESTKLVYSPEITQFIENSNLSYKLIFDINQLKIICEEIEDEEKAKLVKAYLEFSEKVRKISDRAIITNNLDDVELSVIEINKIYQSLEDSTKENNEVKTFHQELIKKLEDFSVEIKQRQTDYQNYLDSLIDNIIKDQNFKEIKSTMEKIEEDFKSDYSINNDTKSKSIRDFAINQLKSMGRIIALSSLIIWEDKHFTIAENILNQPLNLDMLDTLKVKFDEQDLLKRQEKEKLDQLDLNNSESVYKKFVELESQKDLFINLFEKIKAENKLKSLLETIDNINDLILLFSNNLSKENIQLVWSLISEKIREKIFNSDFSYQDIKTNENRDSYYLFVTEYATNDIIEKIFSTMDSAYIKQMAENVLSKVIIRISKFTYKPDDLLKKINLKKLLSLLNTEDAKTNDYLKSSIVRSLIKWVPRLPSNSEELNKILIDYPEFAVYEITRKQLKETDNQIILTLSQKIENNKELLAQLVKKLGKEKIEDVVKTKLESDLKEQPDNFDHQYNVALNDMAHQRYDEAIKGFKKCASINPENPLTQYMLGYTYELKGQNEVAISYYKKATQLKYNYTDAYYALGMIYTKMKDHFLAIQQFKKILKTEPDHYDACVSLGVAYDEMGELDQALEYYEKAIVINPEKVDAYINKAIIYTIKGETDKAIETNILATEKSQENPKIQYNLGLLYHSKKDYSTAIAHYKLSLKFDKNNSMAYSNLGLAYFSKVRVNDAMEMWEKAVEIDPKNADAYNNLAWGYNVIGKVDLSIETYLKAQKIDPKYPVLYMNLGTVYYKNNELEKAIKQLEIYLDLEPDSDNSYEIIKILKSLRSQLANKIV